MLAKLVSLTIIFGINPAPYSGRAALRQRDCATPGLYPLIYLPFKKAHRCSHS
jgi:hypothetical protein